MPQYAALHPDLQRFFLRQKRSSEKEIQAYLEIITCDPSIYTLLYTISSLLYQNRRTNPLVHRGLNAH